MTFNKGHQERSLRFVKWPAVFSRPVTILLKLSIGAGGCSLSLHSIRWIAFLHPLSNLSGVLKMCNEFYKLNQNNKIYTFDKPFFHAIIDDIFDNKSYVNIKSLAEDISTETLSLHPSGYHFGAWKDLILIKTLYSKSFCSLLENITTYKLKVSPTYCVPQLYRFSQENSQLPIHTDFDKDREYATIYYISDWDKDYGGELCLYENDNGNYKCIQKICPKPNRIILMKIESKSWHSVNKIAKVPRNTIITDWVRK